MTPIEPKVSLQARYDVPQTLRLLKTSRPTLMKYARMGYIKYGLHRTNGRKFFLGSEIIRCWRAVY